MNGHAKHYTQMHVIYLLVSNSLNEAVAGSKSRRILVVYFVSRDDRPLMAPMNLMMELPEGFRMKPGGFPSRIIAIRSREWKTHRGVGAAVDRYACSSDILLIDTERAIPVSHFTSNECTRMNTERHFLRETLI